MPDGRVIHLTHSGTVGPGARISLLGAGLPRFPAVAPVLRLDNSTEESFDAETAPQMHASLEAISQRLSGVFSSLNASIAESAADYRQLLQKIEDVVSAVSRRHLSKHPTCSVCSMKGLIPVRSPYLCSHGNCSIQIYGFNSSHYAFDERTQPPPTEFYELGPSGDNSSASSSTETENVEWCPVSRKMHRPTSLQQTYGSLYIIPSYISEVISHLNETVVWLRDLGKYTDVPMDVASAIRTVEERVNAIRRRHRHMDHGASTRLGQARGLSFMTSFPVNFPAPSYVSTDVLQERSLRWRARWLRHLETYFSSLRLDALDLSDSIKASMRLLAAFHVPRRARSAPNSTSMAQKFVCSECWPRLLQLSALYSFEQPPTPASLLYMEEYASFWGSLHLDVSVSFPSVLDAGAREALRQALKP